MDSTHSSLHDADVNLRPYEDDEFEDESDSAANSGETLTQNAHVVFEHTANTSSMAYGSDYEDDFQEELLSDDSTNSRDMSIRTPFQPQVLHVIQHADDQQLQNDSYLDDSRRLNTSSATAPITYAALGCTNFDVYSSTQMDTYATVPSNLSREDSNSSSLTPVQQFPSGVSHTATVRDEDDESPRDMSPSHETTPIDKAKAIYQHLSHQFHADGDLTSASVSPTYSAVSAEASTTTNSTYEYSSASPSQAVPPHALQHSFPYEADVFVSRNTHEGLQQLDRVDDRVDRDMSGTGRVPTLEDTYAAPPLVGGPSGGGGHDYRSHFDAMQVTYNHSAPDSHVVTHSDTAPHGAAITQQAPSHSGNTLRDFASHIGAPHGASLSRTSSHSRSGTDGSEELRSELARLLGQGHTQGSMAITSDAELVRTGEELRQSLAYSRTGIAANMGSDTTTSGSVTSSSAVTSHQPPASPSPRLQATSYHSRESHDAIHVSDSHSPRPRTQLPPSSAAHPTGLATRKATRKAPTTSQWSTAESSPSSTSSSSSTSSTHLHPHAHPHLRISNPCLPRTTLTPRPHSASAVLDGARSSQHSPRRAFSRSPSLLPSSIATTGAQSVQSYLEASIPVHAHTPAGSSSSVAYTAHTSSSSSVPHTSATHFSATHSSATHSSVTTASPLISVTVPPPSSPSAPTHAPSHTPTPSHTHAPSHTDADADAPSLTPLELFDMRSTALLARIARAVTAPSLAGQTHTSPDTSVLRHIVQVVEHERARLVASLRPRANHSVDTSAVPIAGSISAMGTTDAAKTASVAMHLSGQAPKTVHEDAGGTSIQSTAERVSPRVPSSPTATTTQLDAQEGKQTTSPTTQLDTSEGKQGASPAQPPTPSPVDALRELLRAALATKQHSSNTTSATEGNAAVQDGSRAILTHPTARSVIRRAPGAVQVLPRDTQHLQSQPPRPHISTHTRSQGLRPSSHTRARSTTQPPRASAPLPHAKSISNASPPKRRIQIPPVAPAAPPRPPSGSVPAPRASPPAATPSLPPCDPLSVTGPNPYHVVPPSIATSVPRPTRSTNSVALSATRPQPRGKKRKVGRGKSKKTSAGVSNGGIALSTANLGRILRMTMQQNKPWVTNFAASSCLTNGLFGWPQTLSQHKMQARARAAMAKFAAERGEAALCEDRGVLHEYITGERYVLVSKKERLGRQHRRAVARLKAMRVAAVGEPNNHGILANGVRLAPTKADVPSAAASCLDEWWWGDPQEGTAQEHIADGEERLLCGCGKPLPQRTVDTWRLLRWAATGSSVQQRTAIPSFSRFGFLQALLALPLLALFLHSPAAQPTAAELDAAARAAMDSDAGEEEGEEPQTRLSPSAQRLQSFLSSLCFCPRSSLALLIDRLPLPPALLPLRPTHTVARPSRAGAVMLLEQPLPPLPHVNALPVLTLSPSATTTIAAGHPGDSASGHVEVPYVRVSLRKQPWTNPTAPPPMHGALPRLRPGQDAMSAATSDTPQLSRAATSALYRVLSRPVAAALLSHMLHAHRHTLLCCAGAALERTYQSDATGHEEHSSRQSLAHAASVSAPRNVLPLALAGLGLCTLCGCVRAWDASQTSGLDNCDGRAGEVDTGRTWSRGNASVPARARAHVRSVLSNTTDAAHARVPTTPAENHSHNPFLDAVFTPVSTSTTDAALPRAPYAFLCDAAHLRAACATLRRALCAAWGIDYAATLTRKCGCIGQRARRDTGLDLFAHAQCGDTCGPVHTGVTGASGARPATGDSCSWRFEQRNCDAGRISNISTPGEAISRQCECRDVTDNGRHHECQPSPGSVQVRGQSAQKPVGTTIAGSSTLPYTSASPHHARHMDAENASKDVLTHPDNSLSTDRGSRKVSTNAHPLTGIEMLPRGPTHAPSASLAPSQARKSVGFSVKVSSSPVEDTTTRVSCSLTPHTHATPSTSSEPRRDTAYTHHTHSIAISSSLGSGVAPSAGLPTASRRMVPSPKRFHEIYSSGYLRRAIASEEDTGVAEPAEDAAQRRPAVEEVIPLSAVPVTSMLYPIAQNGVARVDVHRHMALAEDAKAHARRVLAHNQQQATLDIDVGVVPNAHTSDAEAWAADHAAQQVYALEHPQPQPASVWGAHANNSVARVWADPLGDYSEGVAADACLYEDRYGPESRAERRQAVLIAEVERRAHEMGEAVAYTQRPIPEEVPVERPVDSTVAQLVHSAYPAVSADATRRFVTDMATKYSRNSQWDDGVPAHLVDRAAIARVMDAAETDGGRTRPLDPLSAYVCDGFAEERQRVDETWDKAQAAMRNYSTMTSHREEEAADTRTARTTSYPVDANTASPRVLSLPEMYPPFGADADTNAIRASILKQHTHVLTSGGVANLTDPAHVRHRAPEARPVEGYLVGSAGGFASERTALAWEGDGEDRDILLRHGADRSVTEREQAWRYVEPPARARGSASTRTSTGTASARVGASREYVSRDDGDVFTVSRAGASARQGASKRYTDAQIDSLLAQTSTSTTARTSRPFAEDTTPLTGRNTTPNTSRYSATHLVTDLAATSAARAPTARFRGWEGAGEVNGVRTRKYTEEEIERLLNKY